MTKKKFQAPSIDQWFIELESVIRHEILSYIVDSKAIEEGLWMWDGYDFIKALEVDMDCMSEYLDKLLEIDNEYEALELEGSAGSIYGAEQAALFLEEKDFLIQVMDNSELKDLSYEALCRLTITYPLAKKTIERYLEGLNGNELPSCLRSPKLNEDFRINNLWDSNNIEDIVKYHLHLLDGQTNEPSKLAKPKLITSIKRNQYIDILPIQPTPCSESHQGLELVVKYKWGVINSLEEPHRSKILTFCNDLVQAYTKHLSNRNEDEDNLSPDYTSLPIPPPQKRYVTRYDSYLPLLIGLYCVKNEHRYKEIKSREGEVEFNSFIDFLKKDLLVKFDCLNDSYDVWSKRAGNSQSVDRKFYIDSVLSRKVKANIASVKSLINEIEKEYFSCISSD